MEFKYAKIIVFVPTSHADSMREKLMKFGAGHIGNYDFCSFSSKGIGRFRPLEGTNPFIGESGKIEQVKEEKIETICPFDSIKTLVEEIKKSHPYEEPAIDIYPLLNGDF